MTGSSEDTLVKMAHCWKTHVAAHMWSANFAICDEMPMGLCA